MGRLYLGYGWFYFSTLPEFVVIAFLVKVSPLAAIVTSMVTIFNNGLAFSIYSFFLPKDKQGVYAMPRSMTIAGGELLIAGGAIVFIVGLVMMLMQGNGTAPSSHIRSSRDRSRL